MKTTGGHCKKIFCAMTLLVLVAASGCANYKLGSTLAENLRDVYVPNVRNESGQPGVEIEVTKAIQREIQREGTLRLVSQDRASARLDVVIVSYDQNSIRLNNNNTDKTKEYRMVLKAEVTFTDLNAKDPGKAVIVQNVSEGDTTFIGGTDTITSRQRNLPVVAEDLAKRIVEDCISAW